MSFPLLKYTPSKYQFYINNSEKNEKDLHFKNNKISTRKYNIITFLPKSLIIQFLRPANIYFLIIAIIECIPLISPLSPLNAILPLILVLSVSLIREGIEDFQKSKMDKSQNLEKIEVFRNGFWNFVNSGDLKMGEIISVKKDKIFPCDLILLGSDLNDGICYVETGSLDGEKTLKIKEPPEYMKDKFVCEKFLNGEHSSESYFETFNNDNFVNGNFNNENYGKNNFINDDNFSDLNNRNGKDFNNKKIREKIDYFSIEGYGICDKPNNNLYLLNGKMRLMFNGDDTEFHIGNKNLLLKGAKLKNTHWIVGVIIYTGHNCKIMKNAKELKIKYSSVELLMNKLLFFILFFQIISQSPIPNPQSPYIVNYNYE